VRIIQFSDTHISHFGGVGHGAAERLADYLNEVAQPDLVVNTGDVVILDPDSTEDRDAAMRIHERIDAPLRVLPGNHDVGECAPEPWRGIRVSSRRVQGFRSAWGSDRFVPPQAARHRRRRPGECHGDRGGAGTDRWRPSSGSPRDALTSAAPGSRYRAGNGSRLLEEDLVGALMSSQLHELGVYAVSGSWKRTRWVRFHQSESAIAAAMSRPPPTANQEARSMCLRTIVKAAGSLASVLLSCAASCAR
jgi:3',5'-cyclic AMP phosphodiesterase CpdA